MRNTKMNENDQAAASLGVEVLDDRDGLATVTMTVRADMANGFGLAHGGFIFALADTAFAHACNNSEDTTAVGASAEITYLHPGRVGQLLTATAERRQEFGRSGIYDVTVTDETGTVIAEFRGHSRTIQAF